MVRLKWLLVLVAVSAAAVFGVFQVRSGAVSVERLSQLFLTGEMVIVIREHRGKPDTAYAILDRQLREKPVVVGALREPASRVYGELYALLLEDDGFKVTRRFDFAGSTEIQRAAGAGEVHLYPATDAAHPAVWGPMVEGTPGLADRFAALHQHATPEKLQPLVAAAEANQPLTEAAKAFLHQEGLIK